MRYIKNDFIFFRRLQARASDRLRSLRVSNESKSYPLRYATGIVRRLNRRKQVFFFSLVPDKSCCKTTQTNMQIYWSTSGRLVELVPQSHIENEDFRATERLLCHFHHRDKKTLDSRGRSQTFDASNDFINRLSADIGSTKINHWNFFRFIPLSLK